VEGECEFCVAEFKARLHLIGMSVSGWFETHEMGRKVRFPLEEKLIFPLNFDRL
jgi:hypothetical protein